MSKERAVIDGVGHESQLVEWKESWRDEYLKWICGFANAQGGVLAIGRDDRGKTAVKPGKPAKTTNKGSEKGSEKSSEKILRLLLVSPSLSAREMAERLGITARAVEKQLAALKSQNRIRRIGPAKGGYWEIIDG